MIFFLDNCTAFSDSVSKLDMVSSRIMKIGVFIKILQLINVVVILYITCFHDLQCCCDIVLEGVIKS